MYKVIVSVMLTVALLVFGITVDVIYTAATAVADGGGE